MAIFENIGLHADRACAATPMTQLANLMLQSRTLDELSFFNFNLSPIRWEKSREAAGGMDNVVANIIASELEIKQFQHPGQLRLQSTYRPVGFI
jgi:hypothetical protein